MIYSGIIEGRYVDLRSCTEDDAEFTLALRQDPELGRFFPAVDNTVEKQREWIRRQREKAGDYFFVVLNKAGERIGTVAVYNIKGDEGEGGRLIVRSDGPFDAMEAQLLLFKFSFYILGLRNVKSYVQADNQRALRFNRQCCGKMFEPVMNEAGTMIVPVETTKEMFDKIEKRIGSMIYRESKRKN